MKRWLIVPLGVCLAFGTLGVSGGPVPVDPETEKAAIARAVDASIGWFKDKNFDLLFNVLADDPDLFMFQPTSGSTVHGMEQFRASSQIWRDPANKYVSHEIRDLRIHQHPSGEVAWFSAVLDDCGDYGGKVGCWKDTRWTGVLEKREGRWVIMQMHFSFAADKVLKANEERAKTR
jgi:ketosteroid isomerase-like protein